MSPVKVKITYCAECGYEPQTLDLAKDLMNTFAHDLASIELIPWEGGTFDVRVGDRLVHSMRQENQFVGVQVVVNPIVISVERVAIPVCGQNLKRKESQEPIEIQDFFQLRHAPGWVGLLASGGQHVEHRAILRIIAAGRIQEIGNILAESAVPKISVGVLEMAFQKLLVPSLDQDKQPEGAAIQFHRGMSGARHGNPCGNK